MDLKVAKDDARIKRGTAQEIFDGDSLSDDAVGEIDFGPSGGRNVTLFERYKGTFKSHEECVAFIKGVEVVLNRMIG